MPLKQATQNLAVLSLILKCIFPPNTGKVSQTFELILYLHIWSFEILMKFFLEGPGNQKYNWHHIMLKVLWQRQYFYPLYKIFPHSVKWPIKTIWEDIAWLSLHNLLCRCAPWDLQYCPGVTKATHILWLGTKGQMLIIYFMHSRKIIANPQGEIFCWCWTSEFLENKINNDT